MEQYTYKPKKFYFIVFALTWSFWMLAIIFKNSSLLFPLMFLGLITPAITAITFVFASKNELLKKDFKRKIVGFYRIKPLYILLAILAFGIAVVLSIGTSVLFGGSANQFSFTDDFSFSIAGTSALLIIFLASSVEELGWRGYGEDAIGSKFNWFKESIIFGIIWACWHLPLFLIPGSYQFSLQELGILYILNFLISVIPLNFLQTWVYVKNNRSMLATIIFHIFVNIMQEKIAMTPETKCIETIFILLVAGIVVWTNKEMFFETKHVGKLLETQSKKEKTNEKQ